ncbi:MAG: Na+/H+ antiporter subunit E [Caldilineaceae bacterium]|nr:Na+/H+ antiporter subunit E [Caldilineaceae bacterium]
MNDQLAPSTRPSSRSSVAERNQRVVFLLLVNIGLAVLWHVFLSAWGAIDYLIGLVIGASALTIYEREYGRRIVALISFVFYVLGQIVVSNINVARVVLQRNPKIYPAIIGVPLTADGNVEVIILATVLTLTPGTVSVDLHEDEHGQRTLYVHDFVLQDPDTFRHKIKDSFERRLLLVTRGEAP